MKLYHWTTRASAQQLVERRASENIHGPTGHLLLVDRIDVDPSVLPGEVVVEMELDLSTRELTEGVRPQAIEQGFYGTYLAAEAIDRRASALRIVPDPSGLAEHRRALDGIVASGYLSAAQADEEFERFRRQALRRLVERGDT